MKALYKILCLCAAPLLSGCTADELLSSLKGEETLTVTVNLPEDITTRAFSDGLTATCLTYGVYSVDGEENLTLVSSVERLNCFAKRTATVDITLVKEQQYKIVFWADAGDLCPYTIDLENKTVTMDYATEQTIEGNNERRDAFYCCLDVADVTSVEEVSVTLTRPLAQLNFGTNDLQAEIIRDNAPASEIAFTVKVPAGLPTVFHLDTQEADEATEGEVEFVYTGVPANSFPVSGYQYVMMNYVLCGASTDEPQQTMSNAVTTLTASHEEGIGRDIVCEINNLPLQRNYRTNVYGTLLTNPLDFEVKVEPAYTDDSAFDANVGSDQINYYIWQESDLETVEANGGRAILMTDITASKVYTFRKATTLYMNGYTLNFAQVSESYAAVGSTNVAYSVLANDSLTIIGSSGEVSMAGSLVMSGENAVLTASDVTFDLSLTCDTMAAAVVCNGASDATNYITDCSFTVHSNVTYETKDRTFKTSGVLCYSGTTVIEGCTISTTSSNEAEGVMSQGDADVTVTNCTISASTGENGVRARGVYCSSSGTTTIDNCIVYAENLSTTNGKTCFGIYADGSGTVYVKNCQKIEAYSKSPTDATGIWNKSNGVIFVTDCDSIVAINEYTESHTKSTYGLYIEAAGVINISNCPYVAATTIYGYATAVRNGPNKDKLTAGVYGTLFANGCNFVATTTDGSSKQAYGLRGAQSYSVISSNTWTVTSAGNAAYGVYLTHGADVIMTGEKTTVSGSSSSSYDLDVYTTSAGWAALKNCTYTGDAIAMYHSLTAGSGEPSYTMDGEAITSMKLSTSGNYTTYVGSQTTEPTDGE